jgi:hypothetical protein
MRADIEKNASSRGYSVTKPVTGNATLVKN